MFINRVLYIASSTARPHALNAVEWLGFHELGCISFTKISSNRQMHLNHQWGQLLRAPGISSSLQQHVIESHVTQAQRTSIVQVTSYSLTSYSLVDTNFSIRATFLMRYMWAGQSCVTKISASLNVHWFVCLPDNNKQDRTISRDWGNLYINVYETRKQNTAASAKNNW